MLRGSNAAWDSAGWESLHEGEKSTIWDGLGQKWQRGPAPASPENCPRAWIGSVSGVGVVYAPNEGFSLCIVGTLNRILTLRGVHVRPSLATDLGDTASRRVSECDTMWTRPRPVLGAAAHREDEGEHDSSLDGLVQVPQCQRAGTVGF